MQTTEKLKELLMQLPGIGPRQAGRFLHFLLLRGSTWRKEFVQLIAALDTCTAQCSSCMRFFENASLQTIKECKICSNNERTKEQLLVVANDVDIMQIEKGGIYKGKYFVLGSLIPLSSSRKSYARSKELIQLVDKLANAGVLKEIIFALPATPDGEHTSDVLQMELRQKKVNAKMSTFGRGLSLGSEIEYADPDTINSALKNRT